MRPYIITMKHDGGTTDITINGTSAASAVDTLLLTELAPRRAIQKIVDEHGEITLVCSALDAHMLHSTICKVSREARCAGEFAPVNEFQYLANHRDDKTYPDPVAYCGNIPDNPDDDDYEHEVLKILRLFNNDDDIRIIHIDGTTRMQHEEEDERCPASSWTIDFIL